MIIPPAYVSHRNLSNSYARGYKAGQLADLGGLPLAPFTKRRMVEAYGKGFQAGQDAKVSPRPEDGVDAFAYGLAASFGVDSAAGDDRTVAGWFKTIMPTPRERELLALLVRVRDDINEYLRGWRQ